MYPRTTLKPARFSPARKTRPPRTDGPKFGMGGQVGYEYSSRTWGLAGYAEHYDPDFEMQTAFINRVGLTSGYGIVEYTFYPTKYPWLLRITPFSFTQGGRDRNAGGNELLQVSAVRLSFTRQGFLRFDRFDGFETWAGKRFDRGNWRTQGEVQLYRWLFLFGQHLVGKAVFYDPVEPFQGHVQDGRIEITLQPTGRFSQGLNYRRIAFDRESPGERVYDLDIIYSRTTYQFSRQFFLRGIVQYDSSRYQVLTDFLASYELRPGTVAYVGYGSLIERREFIDGQWTLGVGDYRTSQRGLFFKASYLHRF